MIMIMASPRTCPRLVRLLFFFVFFAIERDLGYCRGRDCACANILSHFAFQDRGDLHFFFCGLKISSLSIALNALSVSSGSPNVSSFSSSLSIALNALSVSSGSPNVSSFSSSCHIFLVIFGVLVPPCAFSSRETSSVLLRLLCHRKSLPA
jgi:hypothetical protein